MLLPCFTDIFSGLWTIRPGRVGKEIWGRASVTAKIHEKSVTVVGLIRLVVFIFEQINKKNLSYLKALQQFLVRIWLIGLAAPFQSCKSTTPGGWSSLQGRRRLQFDFQCISPYWMYCRPFLGKRSLQQVSRPSQCRWFQLCPPSLHFQKYWKWSGVSPENLQSRKKTIVHYVLASNLN